MKATNNKEQKATTTKKEDKVMSKKNEKKDNKKAKVEKKQEVKVEETKVEEVKAPAVEELKKKVNREKIASVPQFTNSEFKKLFEDNGCMTRTKANDTSNVVYNTFGTQSRVLQQTKAYQLLLTNGHKKVKEEVVECDNDDVKRFKAFYETLDDDRKKLVVGYEGIEAGKLSFSEMPRERSVKIVSVELLTDYIKYMATFDENKVVVA